MKNGNWVPIDATMAKYLPLDRPYTVIEAIYCLQLNYDKGATVTVAGLAKLWGWKSRGKVSRFLEAIGVEIVYHKDMEKSRNKRGVLVFSKRTYDEHKTDIERTNNGHIRLINNKWLDYETDIKRAYGGHKTDIGCSTINHTTDPYPEKEKEGGTDDRDGNNYSIPISSHNGSGDKQHVKDLSGENGNSDNPVLVDNGNDGNVCTEPACETNLNGGLLNGPDNTKTRAILDATGSGINDDLRHDPGNIGVGSGGTVDGLDGPEAVGKKGVELDREEEVIHDIMGAPEEDEAKPKPAKKKPKKKNGVVLDLSTLDAGFDTSVVEEFITYRKTVKKSALTQRALVGVCRNARKTSETHGGSFSDALVYAMENNWLTPDPKYIDDNKPRYTAFLDDQHGPRSSEKENEKKIADLRRRAQIAQEKWDREHGAVDA